MLFAMGQTEANSLKYDTPRSYKRAIQRVLYQIADKCGELSMLPREQQNFLMQHSALTGDRLYPQTAVYKRVDVQKAIELLQKKNMIQAMKKRRLMRKEEEAGAAKKSRL